MSIQYACGSCGAMFSGTVCSCVMSNTVYAVSLMSVTKYEGTTSVVAPKCFREKIKAEVYAAELQSKISGLDYSNALVIGGHRWYDHDYQDEETSTRIIEMQLS